MSSLLSTNMAAPFAVSKLGLFHGALRKVLANGTSAASKNCSPLLPFSSQSSRLYASTDTKDELYRQITVEVKSHDPAVLKSYQKFTTMAAKELNIDIARILEPQKVITRRSLLKSVFVHKKHFHQYETRTHYRVFEFKHLTGSTASTFLEYIQRNLPEGMAMKVTKHQLHPIPSHLKPPKSRELDADS